MYLLSTSSVAIFLGIGEIQKLLRQRKNAKDTLNTQEYNRLATQFQQLLDAHEKVRSELKLWVQKYSELKVAHGVLTQAYQELIIHYESLERAYNNLKDLYNTLLISHGKLEMEIDRLRHQLQIAVTTTVGLAGVIVTLLLVIFI